MSELSYDLYKGAYFRLFGFLMENSHRNTKQYSSNCLNKGACGFHLEKGILFKAGQRIKAKTTNLAFLDHKRHAHYP